ncbi:MFS transporter [Streptomyces sp. Wb2n-11]|uniref:MFS transporter n=1 Tax=Streptomyces sp. Wb2n-11 TaxID=1030533 RepID=UPI000A675E66|nr:MFS transporter [Streptomyces sp. Wb2n-11]
MSIDASPGLAVRADIAARFERLPLSRWHVLVRVAIGMVTFFEAFDQLLIAYTLPELSREWGLTRSQGTLVLTVGSIGMLIGALFSGRMADRFGRVKVIAVCIGVTSVASLALAACTALEPFLLVRFVQGLAIGGEVPVAAAFIAEITRSFHRGRFVLLYELVFPAGLTVGALVAAWVVPAAGWRWMYVIAAVPGLLAFLIRRTVPESPRWLAESGRLEEAAVVMADIEAKVERATGRPLPPVPAAPAVPAAPEAGDAVGAVAANGSLATPKELAASGFTGLFTGRYLRRTQVIWTVWFCAYFVQYGITSWLPTIYRSEYGLTIGEALRYSTVTSVAGLVGCAVAAFTIDVLGRRRLIALALGLTAPLLITLAVLGGDSAPQLLLWTTLAATFFNAACISLYLYTPELYPTRMRAMGCAAGGAVNRLGVILGPVVVGAVYAGGADIFSAFVLLGCVALVGGLVVALFAEETANRPLEEISP